MNRPDSLLRMVISLGVITIIAGAVLAGVYVMTEEPISQAESQARLEAVKAVAPEFDTLGETAEVADADGRKLQVFPLMKGDSRVGTAIESYSMNGFSGEIVVMVGFDAEGTVTGYEVLRQGETPGLGAKMNDWFRDSRGNRSVIGRNPVEAPLTVAKDGGDIDGITAATISSRAFLDAVNRAATAFKSLQK